MRSFRCNQPPTRPEGAVKPREVCKQATWGLAKMPVYKRFSELLKLEVDAFDTIHNPVQVRHFRIYCSTICGCEEVSVARTTCRFKNHHTHARA